MSKKNSKTSIFPPVVAILGHVDHGKTTLLDAIRKTTIAQREHGGITQKIGAYQVEIQHEGEKRKITFIDTPGHEAFLSMRSRGASASDIALLIVSSSDGVMPQTEESIRHIKEAKVPMLVVLTKSDLTTSDPAKVRSQLTKAGISLEGFGGDVPVVSVSAKKNKGIKELLEMILLVSAMNHITKDEKAPFSGVVIESRIDSHAGVLVSIVVKSGILKLAEQLVCEGTEAKVRGLIGESGKRMTEILPGDPVEVLGFSQIAPVGALVEKKGEQIQKTQDGVSQTKASSVEGKQAIEQMLLPIILKTDVQGSLEAIIAALPQGIGILEKGTGFINEGDVLLAKSSKAIVVGFNTKVKPEALKLAQTEGVLIKTYTIIYELIEELNDAMRELKGENRKILGRAEVIGSFVIKDNKIIGVRVVEGQISKGNKVLLTRSDKEIGKATIASLRQQKENKTTVLKSEECGIILSPSLDFSLGDMLLSYSEASRQ